MSESVLIEARKITKTFEVASGVLREKRWIKAVDEVSFQIEEGGNLTLVGESGCGKSTLGRLTLGLLRPSSGEIYFQGKDIWKMNKKEFDHFRRNAQIIHQDPYTTLNPVRTIYQALVPPLLQHKVVRNREEAYKEAERLLSTVGMNPPSDFLGRHPSRMSGGQMERAAIARAISITPKYIVADEAVSMLDASLRLGVVDLLLDLQKELKMSYMFITHDLGIARYFAVKGGGSMAVMYLGKLVEIGEGEELIQRPVHPYTQTLIAATPVPDPKLTRKREIPPLKSLEIPKLTAVPPGCSFHTRCPYSEEICQEEVPELREIRSRKVACHFAEKFI